MPKKKSKAPKETKESTVLEEVKSSTAPKKVCNEIDEIFSGKKRKKPENEKVKRDKNKGEKSKSAKKDKKSKEDIQQQFTERGSKIRRKTVDGFTIYTEGELGINNANAGGTPFCPFDCECCF